MQGMVLVKVGPKSVHHHVHKALLVHHSEYFRNSLTGPWTEAQEQVINLNDVEPSTCKSRRDQCKTYFRHLETPLLSYM